MKKILVIMSFWMIASCAKRFHPEQALTKLDFEPITVTTIHQNSGSLGQCEPSICINPLNKKHIVAGSVLDNVYVSNDGGINWKVQKMKSSHGVYGDPVVRMTKDGTPLFAHLANSKGKAYSSPEFLDRIVVQRSEDGGTSWNDGSFPKVDHTKDHDKQWMSVGPDGTVLMTWTEFDKYGSDKKEHKSRILFSKSKDGGLTWDNAKVISSFEGDCLDGDLTTEGAYPVIGSDGTYHVVWTYDNKIWFNSSRDEGKTWLKEEKSIADQPGGWSFEIPGIGRANGMPVMVCDHSKGPNKGTLYVSWSDQRHGVDDTDVWMISSKDQGKTWTQPARVNNDPGGRHQFFSLMDIVQHTGYLYFVFYDRRNYSDNQTDVFLAYTLNSGKTFENVQISQIPFTPEATLFFGDYNDISCSGNSIRPICTRQDDKTLSVQTAIINVKK